MRETGITRLLRSAAREGDNLQSGRYKLLARLMNRDEHLGAIPEHLMKRLLRLRGGWKVLDIQPRDWQQIGSLPDVGSIAASNIIRVAVEYVMANRERVALLVDAAQIYSDCMIGRDQADLLPLSGRIDQIDQQSIFMFKVQSIIHQFAHTEYIDYLRGAQHAFWVRTRLAGPLAYHMLNTPTESYLDTFLSYMIPQDDGQGSERPLVRHILRDDLSYEKGLPYISLVGLFAHPFDLLEALTSAFEREAASGELQEESQGILDLLANTFPASRAANLQKYLGWRLKPNNQHSTAPFGAGRLPTSVTDLVRAFVDVESERPAVEELPTEHWQALARMRWSRYPDPADFEITTMFARAYNFLEAGRLITALNTSMYMLPRAPEAVEQTHLMRLHAAAAATSPYIWGAPRGDTLMALQAKSDLKSWLGADLKAGAALAKRSGAPDRSWFHSVHWELRKSEKALHVKRWLEVIRAHFPIQPRYLTGIDWTWIDRVLPLTRVAPFRANPDGPFALLLRDIEEDNKDSTLLRTSIEPLRNGSSCADFVGRLIEEYGSDAVAFVRYFLSADTIMLMGLAPNMTAALSERISALESCVARFGFGLLLSEEELRLEQQALTASLMLLSVNDNQFDVPWASFKRDAGNRQRDNYKTYESMRSADQVLALVTDTASLYSHRFPNGRVLDYTLTSRTGALSLFCIGIIDAFYDHPSYGIEAILSTRFRHDTFRREFSAAFEVLAVSHMPGVVPQEQAYIVRVLADACLSATDDWLSRRMQTLRPGHEDAIFDFTPEAEDLDRLVGTIASTSGLEAAIDAVIEWITGRLDEGLLKARQLFNNELIQRIPALINDACESVRCDYSADPTVLRTVAAAALTTYVRTADLLMEWFSRPADDLQRSLTFEQIKLAVDGRFERAITEGKLHVSLVPSDLASESIQPEHVKLLFDLQTEIVRNALKYADTSRIRISIRQYDFGESRGFVFSSLSSPGTPSRTTIEGHQYRSLSDALFREGNSGLDKVAALAASIYGGELRILAERRRRSFHVVVPLRQNSGDDHA